MIIKINRIKVLHELKSPKQLYIFNLQILNLKIQAKSQFPLGINKNQIKQSHSNMRNLTEERNPYSQLFQVQASYPTALYVLCPILIIYFGLYLMLRNHYIFRPRIQIFLKKSPYKSAILKELITDILSSLPIFIFALCSIVLVSTDEAIQTIINHDLYWSGLCLSVLSYRNIKQESHLEMKVVVKNSIFLILTYGVIGYQYFSEYSLLLMGLLLMGLYISNLIFKLYEQKFVNLIEILFNSKPLVISSVPYNHVNKLQSPQYLANNFPVSRQEIDERLSLYEASLKRLKLKTKIAVTKKLLMLSLAIKISQDKMTAKMKRDVAAYYGGLNGTTNEKVKRLDYQLKTSMPDQGLAREGSKEIADQEIILNILQVDDQLEVLFTIFPIKLFESSIIISVIFSLFLNLAFGVCLDYTLSITSTLEYGGYFHYLYGLLILPVLPNLSKTEYFNKMALSSLLKYFLIGLFVTISVAINGGIKISNIIKIKVILVTAMIIFAIGFLLIESKNQYKLFIVFFLLFATNLGISYSGAEKSS